MTQTISPPSRTDVSDARPDDGGGGERRLAVFVKVASALLVVGLVGFGVLYWQDQHVAAPPSIGEQRVAKAEDAVRKAPNNVPARLQLGVMYGEAGRIGDSLTQFDAVLKVDKGNLDARVGKGYVLLQHGDLDKAAREYAAVTGTSRTGEFAGADTRLASAYYYLGIIALKQHQPVKAMAQLDQARRIEPTDSDVMFQVGLAQLQLGRHADAVATFKRALTFVPTSWCDPYPQMQAAYTALKQPAQASYAGAMNTFCQRDARQAKQQLTALTSGPAAVDAMLGLGLIAQVENDRTGAIGWYRKVLVKDPKNTTAMSYLAALGVPPATTAATK